MKDENGIQAHIADLGAGDYFGEMAAWADVSRNATVRAAEPLNVLLIPKNDFNLLKNIVPDLRDVFRELATRRAAAGAPDKAETRH